MIKIINKNNNNHYEVNNVCFRNTIGGEDR